MMSHISKLVCSCKVTCLLDMSYVYLKNFCYYLIFTLFFCKSISVVHHHKLFSHQVKCELLERQRYFSLILIQTSVNFSG